MVSKCRQNYHGETEAAVNKQINFELNAHYQYLALAAFYDRDDVALKGFASFFKEGADDEYEHAQKLIRYQNLRGGRVILTAVDRPPHHEVATPLAAMELALSIEKQNNQCLLDLHKLAKSHTDPHLTNYLETEFLQEQAKMINLLAKHHTNLIRVGEGLGVYEFDKDLGRTVRSAGGQ